MPKVTKAERIALHKEWEQRIAQFQASGQTGTAWCAANQVNLHQFRYWIRKFQTELQSKPAPSIKWLSIKMDSSPPMEDDSLTIHIGKASIQVSSGFSPTLLKQAVQALAHVE